MKLSIRERLDTIKILPTMSSIEKIKKIKVLKKKLMFNDSEIVEYGIKILKPVVCDSCNTQFIISDANIDPVKSVHTCPKCNCVDYTETGHQQINWNIEAERDADVEFDVHEMAIITEALELSSKENKVDEGMIGLYEKFSLNC